MSSKPETLSVLLFNMLTLSYSSNRSFIQNIDLSSIRMNIFLYLIHLAIKILLSI